MPDFDAEPSSYELRSTYRIIQILKRIRHERVMAGRDGQPSNANGSVEHSDAIDIPGDATARDAVLALVRRRVARMRPEMSWRDIADTLDMNVRTLWKRRIAAFPEGHQYHPESGETNTHAKPE